jgi:hypothetical protein
MRPEEIRDKLRRREVVIGVPGNTGGLPVRSVCCDPFHVTRIEAIDGVWLPGRSAAAARAAVCWNGRALAPAAP